MDISDTRAFSEVAEPGEWAVTGAFRYAHRDPAGLRGRELQAFKHAWLGLESFGSAAFVEVAEFGADALEAMARRLAAHLLERYGAPDALQAVEAAHQEMEFAASLCGHPAGTILALDREFNDQGLIEKVRVISTS
jgi:hypothetical protein